MTTERCTLCAMRSPIVRPERDDDRSAVEAVLLDAFESPLEANLVQALRDADAITLSRVAEIDGEVVGHIAFSPVSIAGRSDPYEAVGLAPVAVLGAHQRQGIGGALIEAALETLRREGHALVVVLGHPRYYPRFGFARADGFGVRWEHDAPPQAFMALELVPGAARPGVVRFHPAFAAVS